MKKFLRIIYRCIPTFRKGGLIFRIFASVLLIAICCGLLYVKGSQVLPLLQGMLSFSPVTYAQELVDRDRRRTAEKYIEFYKAIPGVPENAELDNLYQQICAERKTISHHVRHAYKGIKREESDEHIAKISDIAADVTSIGDARDLYEQWQNYSTGKKVDKLTAGLAGIGLVMTIGEVGGMISGLFTGGTSTAAAIATFEPVKKTTLLLKRSIKICNPQLRAAIQKLFAPIFREIQQTKILQNLPFDQIKAGSFKEKLSHIAAFIDRKRIRAFIEQNYANICRIAAETKEKMATFADLKNLALKDKRAAALVMRTANNLDDLSHLSRVALKLGDKGGAIFRFGGKPALEAAVALEKRGKLSASTIQQAMRYGKDGLVAISKGVWCIVENVLNSYKRYKITAKLLIIIALLVEVPWPVAIVATILGLLIVAKSWVGNGKMPMSEAGADVQRD